MFVSDLQGIPLIDDNNADQFARTITNGVSDTGYMRPDPNAPRARCGVAGLSKDMYIDRSLWPAMIEEKERNKTRLSDVLKRQGKIWLHQGNTNSCATADTEVLTERGWTPWPDYNGSDLLGTMNTDSGMLEFQAPLERQVLEHNGEMIYSTNKRMDFAVTPDHRMLVRKWDERMRTLSNRFTFQRAGELGWYVGLPNATRGFVGTYLKTIAIEGDRQYAGDDFLALLALITSDGYAGGSESTRNWVSFCCFREDRYEMVADLANRVGFKENPSRKGVWTRYSAAALANWCRANCYTGSTYSSLYKRVPDLVKVASQHQIEHFLRFFGDQSHTGQKSFCSTSKRMIDDLQELLLRIGKRGTIWKTHDPGTAEIRGRKIESHTVYSLGVSETNRLCLERKNHIETDHYKGLVYCATVPNGTLITRRNGSVLISGNCWAFAVVQAVMAVRATSNLPPVRLSPTSVSAPIKNYRDQGGWGNQALDYIAENGVCAEEFWPLNEFNRKYFEPSRENAALHKIEEWWDIPGDFDAKASLMLRNIPVPSGYNWMGHEMMGCDLVLLPGGRFGCVDLNSYPPDGSFDPYALSESKGTGEDQVAPRSVTPSEI